jgi:hypothetical protein
MSSDFLASSSQCINNDTSPISGTVYPFTIGCWFNPRSLPGGDNAMIFPVNYNSGSNYINIATTTAGSGTVYFDVNDGSGDNYLYSTTPLIFGSWHFAMFRGISATNRRITILLPGGVIDNTQSTVSKAPSGIDKLIIGAAGFSTAPLIIPYDGRVAEFWCTNTDVQPDGAATSNALTQQLAYGGPFSVPHIASSIADYRSFRKHPTNDEVGETAWGGKGKQTWTNTNGVTIAPHPPLSSSYVRPGQTKRVLTI